MKKVLIIYPHYPPSNLAGVHRPRLFAQHLPSFGWEPVILTVDEKYYEEKPDWNLVKLLPAQQQIHKVKAFKRIGPIGDIGLRGWWQLYKKALDILRRDKIDFIYIPIPSFYTALIGPKLFRKTGVPYGIDYIDPWVHEFPGSKKLFSKAWFSSRLAKKLEPVALKHVALITGVATGYYQAVLDRNPSLKEKVLTGAMPYGGEIQDHQMVKKEQLRPYLFQPNGKFQMVYAGALLPRSYAILQIIFDCIKTHPDIFADVEFHFIGTGIPTTGEIRSVVAPMASESGIWQKQVFEYPDRVPYLDVLTHLEHADAVFILGSTEVHYTPSKTYQAVMSRKPIFAVLHEHSTGVQVVETSLAGTVLKMEQDDPLRSVKENFMEAFKRFRVFSAGFDPSVINQELFNNYSAYHVTQILANLLNQVVTR